MSVYADTSLFFAFLDNQDRFHQAADAVVQELTAAKTPLVSSNYVMLETNALLQRRIGMTAVRAFEQAFTPLLEIIWVDDQIHRSGIAMLLTANRRSLSLVDCTSFEIMRREGINTVLTLDRDFADQGFEVLPERGL